MRRLNKLLLACLCLSTSLALAAAMPVRYWDWGRTPKRDAYQFAVLQMALDKTRAEFGPYELSRVVADYSSARSRREISEGQVINVQATPWRQLDPASPLDQRIPVKVPLMGGLLGYRSMLIRKEDEARFNAIRTPAELKALMMGQGRGWAELDLYRSNGFRVMDTGDAKTLLPMLAHKRFDYLPMSVVEVESALSVFPELADKVMIAPNLVISYPLPTIFYVSAAHPRLAERLETGLKAATQDGTLAALLKQHFSREITGLGNVSRHFSMVDPSVPKALLTEPPPMRKGSQRPPHAAP